MGLTMGTGPFGKQPARTSTSSPSAKACAVPRALAAAGARGDQRGDGRRLERTSRSCTRRDISRSGTSRARTFASNGSRRPITRAHCPFKGDARYWTIRAGGRVAENKVWGYPEILPETPDITDRVAFYWDAVDHWYEEDEEVFVHPRDPYHRVDAIKELPRGQDLARRRRAGRVEPPRRRLRDRGCRRAGTSPRTTSRCRTSPRPRARRAPTRAPRRTGTSAESRPGAMRTPIAVASALTGLVAFYDEIVDVDIDGERQERRSPRSREAGSHAER